MRFRRAVLPLLPVVLAVATAIPTVGSASVLAAHPAQASASASAPAAVPTHGLTVSGVGVGSYPAFDPAVERYAVTTSAATGGTVTVHASTSDPAGVVRVDGVVAPGGTATLTGLTAGDEISVFISDRAGTAVHSLFYLPAGFPELEAVASSPDVQPGQIGLTLFRFLSNDPRFAAAVDRNGVPIHVEGIANSHDLKQQPDGSITIAEPARPGERSGSAISVRNGRWEEVARHQTVDPPLKQTDFHDSILLPDGRRFLTAYEPNDTDPTNPTIDSVIQEIAPDGSVTWQWSSEGMENESVASPPASGRWDYAHINSIELLPDGDILASFRHLSSVFRIHPDDTLPDADQVVWKLGGRDSTFTFVDPMGGPCAQHTATLLANGDVLVFDNGSGGVSAPLCVDPSDPAGPPQTRPQSRAAQWALDLDTGTATLVWSHGPDTWYSFFMGSATRFADGHTLIGWADEGRALATELDDDGGLLWELRMAPQDPPQQAYISYRASLMDVPDAFDPEVSVTTPADGAEFAFGQQVTAEFSCTDIGGSSLQTCAGDAVPGGYVDTSSPGTHTFDAVATDGEGNTTTVTRSYTVGPRPPAPPTSAPPTGPAEPSYQPDVQARTRSGRWRDGAQRRVLAPGAKPLAVLLRVVNRGDTADRFVVKGTKGNARFRVGYRTGGKNISGAVRRGTYRTGLLAPGEQVVLRLVVTRTGNAIAGDARTFKLRAKSVRDADAVDRARVTVRAG